VDNLPLAKLGMARFGLKNHSDRQSPMIRSGLLAIAAAALSTLPAYVSLGAAELSADEKQRFVETLCGWAEKTERCLGAGRLVADRSLNWIMFEACSASGERNVVVSCFDRASELATELTGDPRYVENQRRCNRFDGEHVDEAKLLCYRSAFKYRNFYHDRYSHLWDHAASQ
jgi:hypothetical protein